MPTQGGDRRNEKKTFRKFNLNLSSLNINNQQRASLVERQNTEGGEV